MSTNGGIEQDATEHVATADACLARIQETNTEKIDFASVVDDIPPEIVAASHPRELAEGHTLPDAENSCIVSTSIGIYTSGNIASEAVAQYQSLNPHVTISNAPAMAADGLSSTFGMASADIGSLVAAEPAPPATEQPQTATPAFDPFKNGMG